ncbi:MAG: ribonuclease P protein component [Patescibacteria group bacterium]
MLPQKQRIPKALAREVFGRGAVGFSPNFLLKTLKSPDGQTRFAVSISKKVAPTAVLRNRTRRRVYSVIRNLWPKIKHGFLIAITVKKGGEKLPYADIVKEIDGLLSRARLY